MPDSTKTVSAPATRVGTFAPFGLLEQDQETARQFLAQVADAGIDYVCCGDHVSFFGGTADDVAEFLAPYVGAGCTEFNLIPQSPDHDQAIAGVAAVKKLLAQT